MKTQRFSVAKKIALLLSLLGSTASAQSYLELADLNPATKYQHFETEHFEFTYQTGYFNFTKEAAKHFEHAHRIIAPILKWKPRSKIHVLVADNEDSANGFAMAALRVGIVLIATPPDQWLSTSYSENWIKLLAFHEYTHILNMDPTTEWMEWLRIIFGDAIRPNGLWPSWMLEGLAVYLETKTSILGRGRSPYYDAIVRAYFNEGKLGTEKNNGLTYGRLSGPWPYFPGGETNYLLGYQLWNQFAKHTKNDQKMGEYSINSSARVPFFIDGNLENVTGKQWGDYWNTFVDESSARYSTEISKINKIGTTSYTKVSDSQYSAIGGVISPNGEWLAYTETRLDERQGLTLKNLKTGKTEKIKDKLLGISMAFTPDSKRLIFSSLGRNTTFTEFSDLWIYDLDEKDFSQITDGLRAKDPQLSPDGKRVVFTVADHATQILTVAELVLEKNNIHLSNQQTIFKPAEFSMIGTPHWINNSEIVFSQQELNQAESRILKIAAAPNSSPIVLVQNGKMNRYPFLCNDQIHYISDQTGIDNIYSNSKQITNVITSTQFPFCSPKGELYGSLLTSNGFEIVKFSPGSTAIPPSNEKIATPSAPESIPEALRSPEIKVSGNSISSYSPWKTLLPRQWAPFGYFNYDGISGTKLGGLLLGFDATGKHEYLGTFQYNFKSTTTDGGLRYTYYGFRPAISLIAESATNDIGIDGLYERTHEARLQLSHLTRWTWSSLQVTPYAFMSWNAYRDLITHEKIISSDLEYNQPNVPGGGLRLGFNDSIQSKLGFMPEGGSKITTETQAKVYPHNFTLWRFLAEYSRFISTGSHHVLNPKFRLLGSSHYHGANRPYSLLKGKNTNDITDDGTGLSLDSMRIRGYSNRNIKTKSSFNASLDYHFPIDTIFNGTGPFFFGQAHGFIFAETTCIPSTRFPPAVFLPSFGLGITADTTLFWHAPVSISLEMQYGTRKDFGGDQLFFISLGTSLI